jgi:hypothetical protein
VTTISEPKRRRLRFPLLFLSDSYIYAIGALMKDELLDEKQKEI